MTAPRKGRHAKGRITLVILALLSVMVIAASVALAFLLAGRQTPAQTSQPAPDLVQDGFQIADPAESSRLYPFGDGVLKVEDNRISYLEIDGSERWGADVALLEPACYSSGEVFLVVDQGGSAYHMLSTQGVEMFGNAPGSIVGAAIGTDGFFALLLEQPENKGVVRVFSTTTGRAYEWDFISRESGFVLSVAFSPDGSWIDITAVNTDQHVPQSIMKRLETGTGVQHAQFTPDESGIFGAVVYDEDRNAVLISQNRMVGFLPDATIAYSVPFTKILYAHTSDHGVFIVGSDHSSDDASAYLLQSEGVIAGSYLLPAKPDRITVHGAYALVASGSRIDVVGLSPFRHIQTIDTGSDVLQMKFLSEKAIRVVTKEGVGKAVFK